MKSCSGKVNSRKMRFFFHVRKHTVRAILEESMLGFMLASDIVSLWDFSMNSLPGFLESHSDSNACQTGLVCGVLFKELWSFCEMLPTYSFFLPFSTLFPLILIHVFLWFIINVFGWSLQSTVSFLIKINGGISPMGSATVGCPYFIKTQAVHLTKKNNVTRYDYVRNVLDIFFL